MAHDSRDMVALVTGAAEHDRPSVPDLDTFESDQIGQVPRDIGRLKRAFFGVGDRMSSTPCGSGETALFASWG